MLTWVPVSLLAGGSRRLMLFYGFGGIDAVFPSEAGEPPTPGQGAG